MKKLGFLLVLSLFLINCHVPVKQDYNGLSGALVFTQNKKWLINNIYSDLNSVQKENLNAKIFATFQELSNGNATTIDKAVSDQLLPAEISFSPDMEQLESIKNNSGFDYLVNIRTKKIADQINVLELEKPLQYSKNEAFAIVEVYDLKTLKKIYSQKASSEFSSEGKKDAKNNGPLFTYSADMLSEKNLNKILKDIKEKAVK